MFFPAIAASQAEEDVEAQVDACVPDLLARLDEDLLADPFLVEPKQGVASGLQADVYPIQPVFPEPLDLFRGLGVQAARPCIGRDPLYCGKAFPQPVQDRDKVVGRSFQRVCVPQEGCPG